MTVVGIDLSLTCTGIAIAKYGTITETTTVKSKGARGDSLEDRRMRLLGIRMGIEEILHPRRRTIDLIVIEAPSFGSVGGSQHDRSGLWWQLVDEWIDYGIAQVTPMQRAKYGTGKGNSAKADVHAAVKANYAREDLPIRTNDEADAVLLAAMGARHLERPVDVVTPEQLAAMDKVDWP